MLYCAPSTANHVQPLDIHLIAVGGTGMAPLACLLKARGHRVRGSDGPLYPPMSTLLEEAGIRPLVGYDAAHLEERPDLVVVGNAVRRDNPEAVAVEERSIPRLSMPEALARFFLAGRRPLVVAGTHGKTTTTALAAWLYTRCGADPGYLVGGVPQNFQHSFHDGGGERFIIEGDEYNAAYFDRGPKFLHYRPETLLLTSVEHDHADLYPEPAALVAAYEKLVDLVPAAGLVVACGDDADVRRVASRARCRVVFYGLGARNDLRPLAGVESRAEGSCFRLPDGAGGEIAVELPMAGEHNVANALAVWAAARRDSIEVAEAARALAEFRGVKRRMETVGTAGGVTVIDDFAHHPTAVEATLAALRQRYPDRPLVAVFEPRTLTAGRRGLLDAYRRAFRPADRVFLAPIFHAGRLRDDERLDLTSLAARLTADGTPAVAAPELATLPREVVEALAGGDVVVTMSSGAFEDLPRRLLAELDGDAGRAGA